MDNEQARISGLHFIPPGQPCRNGYVEFFNSRVRDECFNINTFWSLTQARRGVEAFPLLPPSLGPL